MKKEPAAQSKRGRPAADRLDTADIDFLRRAIDDTYHSQAKFYKEAFEEARNGKYKGFTQPSDLETVEGAFAHAFSGRRPLPELYWKVLEDLLGIKREMLPSRKGMVPDGVVHSAALPDDQDAAPASASVPNNLPRRERQLLGREAEIEKLLHVLTKSTRFWLVSITGVGGVGKTALALEATHRCLDLRGLPNGKSPEEFRFDAFVWTSAKQTALDGPGIRSRFSVKPNLPSIIHEILKIAAPEKAGALEARQRESALDVLRTSRVLLIVDNMETVEDEQVLGFLKDVPSPSKVIVTDRRAVHESYSLPLMELSLEDAKLLIQEECGSDFLDRLLLTPDQTEELAKKTGGIPLAIIWALGRIAATGGDPSAIIRRLSDADSTPVLDFLFEESYQQISNSSKRLLAALALPGTPVRADMLADWLEMGRNDVEDSLDELRQVALISEHRLVRGEAPRAGLPTFFRCYRLLPLTREFVRKRGVRLDDAFQETICEKQLATVAAKEPNPDWPSIETIDFIEEHHELLLWAVEASYTRDSTRW
jgi:hypothetical protein